MWEAMKKVEYRANAGIAQAQSELDMRRTDRVEIPLPGIRGERLYLTGAAALEERAKQLDALYENLPPQRGAQSVILLDAFSSATIEGARTTVEQVRRSFDRPGTKDDRMVINAIRGSNYAYNNPITAKNIRKLWEMVVDGVCENAQKQGALYRDGMVYIGNSSQIIHVPAPCEDLPQMMNAWFSFRAQNTLHPILAASICHFYFVYAHPFCDGNGRMARILNASELYHKGYRKMKTLPLSGAINRRLGGYYGSLSDSEQVLFDEGTSWLDLSPFVSFLLDAFESCMVDAALSSNRLDEREVRLLERMNHSGPDAEITIKKAAGILNCSVSTARKVLLDLVQKGYLQENRSEQPRRYRLHGSAPN